MDIDPPRRPSVPAQDPTSQSSMLTATQPPSSSATEQPSGGIDVPLPTQIQAQPPSLIQAVSGTRHQNPWQEHSSLAQAHSDISIAPPSMTIHDAPGLSEPNIVVRGSMTGSDSDSDSDAYRDHEPNAEMISSLIRLSATHDRPERLSSWQSAMPALASSLIALSFHPTAERDAVLAEASSLFDAGADPCEVDPSYGRSVLHWLALMGDATVVACLLRRGADRQVNTPDLDGMTPLGLLSRLRISSPGVQRPPGTAAVASLLLDHGAQLQLLPRQGSELLFMIDLTPEFARRLVAMGVPVDAGRIKRETPMLYACQRRNWLLANCLLELGADARARGLFSATALHMAGLPEWLAKALLERGAFPDSRDMTRQTPLMVCCETNNLEVARLLLQYGASPDARSDDNTSVLDIAHVTGGAIEQLIREALMLQPALKLASE